MSQQCLGSESQMLTVVTFASNKKLSTGANGQKEDATSFFRPRSFDPSRAEMIAQWYDLP